jgi:hypothetical protein
VASLPQGIYEALLDEELSSILHRHPELRSVFGKLDPEEAPSRYAAFVAKLLEKALSLESDPLTRVRLCNDVLESISGLPSANFLTTRRLVPVEKQLLLEITPPSYAEGRVPLPSRGSIRHCGETARYELA